MISWIIISLLSIGSWTLYYFISQEAEGDQSLVDQIRGKDQNELIDYLTNK